MPHSSPWAVEQGLTQAAEGRLLAYNASQGQEGLTDPSDCRVSALDIPGAFIQTTIGSYNILNRGAGAGRQMYCGRITSPDKVAVPPTSSTGGRSDLVVIRVENPDVDGIASQAPYAYTRIRQNVPAGTVSIGQVEPTWSALTLARITIPANTGTITNAMITDLRGTLQSPFPAVGQFTDVQAFTGTSTLPPPATGGGYRESAWAQWPGGAVWNVPVPAWATEVALYYQVNAGMTDNTWGSLAIDFNGRWTQTSLFDVNFPLNGTNRVPYTNDGPMRSQYVTGGKVAVLPTERGKTVPIRVMAKTHDDATYRARGASVADRGSVGYFSASFRQAASVS